MSTRAVYGEIFITHFGLGDPTTCVYHFFIGKQNDHTVVIAQFFNLNGLEPCVHFLADVSHMFYEWNYPHCAAAAIMFKKYKHFICVDDYTTIFAWGDF